MWARLDGRDRVVWRGSTSWDWLSVSGNGRCIGEFVASCPSCSTRPHESSSCESQTMRFSVFANAYIDTSMERFSDEVVLLDYDSEWPAKYRQMADWLERRLGSDVALRIEHYGSTAVPGLSAKPIVDILVEVPSFRVAKERVLPLLNDESWEYSWYSDHMILIKRSELMGVRTHHVHFAPAQHAIWRGIAFRDYLRTHPEYALRYEDLKWRLAAVERLPAWQASASGGTPMIGNQVRVVLFDIGGVLVELTGTPMLLSWANNSLSPDDVWVKWLTSPTVRAFETGGIDPTEFSTRLVREMQLSICADELLRQFVVWPKGLYPGALELVRSIPAGYTKATLSNCNCLHWPRFVNEMGLGEAFDLHFPSHLTGKIKPDAEAYAQVIDQLNCRPADILYLDDNKLNTDAAERLGIRAVQVKGVKEAADGLKPSSSAHRRTVGEANIRIPIDLPCDKLAMLNALLHRLKTEFPEGVEIMACYGSYVTGAPNPVSDIDFFFIPATPRGYDRFSLQVPVSWSTCWLLWRSRTPPTSRRGQ